MKFADYFSNNFESSENNIYESLKTRYYRNRINEATDAVKQIIELEKGRIIDENEKFCEIFYETVSYDCTVTFIIMNPLEIAIDFRVTTFNFISFGKGKKVIEHLYNELDKRLQFKGVALSK